MHIINIHTDTDKDTENANLIVNSFAKMILGRKVHYRIYYVTQSHGRN